MKKNFLYCLLILLVAIAGSHQAFSKIQAIESKWAVEPMIIDGSNDDWSGDTLACEKKMSVDYALRNDSNHLYILFIFKDPRYLSSIDMTGISIYFKSDENLKEKHGFKFIRKSITADELISTLEKQGQLLTEEKKNELKLNPHYYLFHSEEIGKEGKTLSPEIPGGQPESPIYKSVRKEKMVIYEFRVPLSRLNLEEEPTGKEVGAGQLIEIGFEWGGMTKEMKKMKAAQLGSEGSTGKATDVSIEEHLSGGSEEGGGGGRSIWGDKSALEALRKGPKKYSFWIDVKLARSQFSSWPIFSIS